MVFRDRTDAGRQLAALLVELQLDRPVVLGMARGGVPVACEVASSLCAPLDVIVVRKLGHPSQPELGLGALAEGGVRVLNATLIEQLGVPETLIDEIAAREGAELERRLAAYRGGRGGIDLEDRTVVVVDDGLATGFTALAAVEAVRRRGAKRVVLAVPVAPPQAVAALEAVADDVVCVEVTEGFFGLSEWYLDFSQVADAQVVELLQSAHSSFSRRASDPEHAITRAIEVPAGGHLLPGELVVPEGAFGLVLFAHGSGSTHMSPRNRSVASALNEAGLATILFDLLTEGEAADRSNVFDVAMLGSRLEAATIWAREMTELARMPVGLFGASTGAGAALVAAAHMGGAISAVVSRGGRPDLAGDLLASVTAPTLLIVGGHDEVVLSLNRDAQALMSAPNRLEIVEGATHLFEEPGALEQVAQLASSWFAAHLHP